MYTISKILIAFKSILPCIIIMETISCDDDDVEDPDVSRKRDRSQCDSHIYSTQRSNIMNIDELDFVSIFLRQNTTVINPKCALSISGIDGLFVS